MKLYDNSTAPSPRRVRIFLAEKGVTVDRVEVDLRAGEHLQPPFRGINPYCVVPVLELDDGTRIGEIPAICRYIEEMHPDPPLMGTDAKDRAIVTMWERRMEMDGFLAAAEAFRNWARGFKGHALTGPVSYDQIPELAERGRARLALFFDTLEERLAESAFIAGPRYTIADITALCTVDFAGWIKLALPETHENARRWHAAVSARPSASA